MSRILGAVRVAVLPACILGGAWMVRDGLLRQTSVAHVAGPYFTVTVPGADRLHLCRLADDLPGVFGMDCLPYRVGDWIRGE